MKQRNLTYLKHLLIGGLFMVANVSALASDDRPSTPQKQYYRFVNEQGIKVVSETIPPQYVRNGYEIITARGDIIKTVASSPSEVDADRLASERRSAKEQARIDLQLKRTYSTPADIDGAKSRNISELQNTINILQGTLISIRGQLKSQEQAAADLERSGKTVTPEMLKSITSLRSEEKDVVSQIEQRNLELKNRSEKYDQDKKRFIEITTPKPQ